MGKIDGASSLARNMETPSVGNLLQFTANNAAFGNWRPATYAKESRLKLRTGSLGMAVAMLLALAILIGCGAAASNGFSASPAVSGSGGSASTGSSSGSSGSGTGSSGSGTATPMATAVQAVNVPSNSIAAGTSSSATVTLNAAAPTGGATVTLTSSNVAAASVPASVMVAADQTAAGFTVKTGSVLSDTSVTITAAYNNTLAGTTVSVKAPVTPPPPAPPSPPPTPISMSLSPAGVGLVAGASQQFTATVTGSTNTAVNWSAAAGTITSTGLFTAPNVSSTTIVAVSAKAQADPTVVKTAYATVTPPPSSGGTGTFSGTGPVASWKAYQYLDNDNLYHQAIVIYNAQGLYPVIGYSSPDPGCTNIRDTFNDFWQPIGNGLWWFINFADYVYVKWVWYDNATNKQILQQTPCIDYSAAPKYN